MRQRRDRFGVFLDTTEGPKHGPCRSGYPWGVQITSIQAYTKQDGMMQLIGETKMASMEWACWEDYDLSCEKHTHRDQIEIYT